MVAVWENKNITPNWFYQHNVQSPAGRIDPLWPLLYFGGWSTTDEPSRGVYYKEVAFAPKLTDRFLHFPGLQVTAQVFVDGQSAGMVNPFNPTIDLSNFSQPGDTVQIAVLIEQAYRQPTGQVILYEGEALNDWHLAGWDEAYLFDLAEKLMSQGSRVHLPLTLQGGEMAWLNVTLPLDVDWERGWDLQFSGQGMKVSALIGKHLVGRIWLPSPMRPSMAGGPDNRIVVPVHWLREASGRIMLLLESVSSEPGVEFNGIRVILAG
jgi:beta-galactosidase